MNELLKMVLSLSLSGTMLIIMLFILVLKQMLGYVIFNRIFQLFIL